MAGKTTAAARMTAKLRSTRYDFTHLATLILCRSAGLKADTGLEKCNFVKKSCLWGSAWVARSLLMCSSESCELRTYHGTASAAP